ncbi:hypothetical protein PIROE2DRAFT_69304 [Piromyces sp. E2]|nr:hypothetical protein PIROE2DRAFT_69304 [Piromyces sp. E2]|eukprot:OUM64070.1 hypothetical protein PIROE2DRAFT_69304 [Piromyces sp. E2]
MEHEQQDNNHESLSDKNNRMNKFNLIIMLLILLFIVLFIFRRYLFRLIVSLKLKFDLMPMSYLDDDLAELESAQLLNNYSGDDNGDDYQVSSNIRRKMNKIINYNNNGNNDSSSSFVDAIESGLSSNNFDVHTNNIETADERTGFDPKDTRILKRIMKNEHCDFDTARLVMQHLKFKKMGIDPATGMPLDSKAFTFESKSRR